MKTLLSCIFLVAMILLTGIYSQAQAPDLGSAASFALFTSTGAVTNTGISKITGNVGTNGGSSTGFGNVNGSMHDNDGVSAQCAADLLVAYNQLNSTTPNYFPAPLLGNGQMLTAGVYAISGASTLNLELILNAQGNSSAVFIFQIQGTLSTAANSGIKLINGAQACNVFWKVEGMVSMAAGTTMRGTIIANNAAIMMNTGDLLEGRALSTAGAVTVNGVTNNIPSGCGAVPPIGPIPPDLASTVCYALFSSNGAVSNTGVTHITGDVGTNVGLTTGFDPLLVNGTIHPIPDVSTAQCAADLLDVYNYLNALPTDIELMYPAQFGNSLVLTPHTYLLDAATTLNDTIFLDALGNPDAVFVIKVNGAFSSNSHAVVMLINGTRARNIFWKIEGAVNLSSYTKFVGTIVCNNAAIGAFATGVSLHGRALTTTGALSTTEVSVVITPGCCTVPLNLQLNGVIQSGIVDCENALQTITVAGNGTTYKILNGGHITMIAGQKIRLLPGTHVYPGGYLHAYITLDGTYCCSLPGNKLAEVAEVVPEQEAGSFFKVYPNPTNGNLYLETDPKYRDVKTEVNIFSLTGNVVLIKEISGSDNYQFAFTDGSKGIYFIRLIMGDRIETKKVIVN